ncbi:MAG: serine/threonine protein kinase [Muribaculaceae bacterium]
MSYPNSAKTEVSNALRAFVSEAGRLQRLGIQHDNIVKVGDVFEANNTAYYVMEYLDGVSLAEYVRQRGRLNFAQAQALLQPVYEAVAILHRNSVAHYDIKPQNIMIVNRGGREHAVLIDFGLAKHYDGQGQATSSLATAGYTPGYAPVEQYTGIHRFAPTADVYALAATMTFCLTGHAPAKADELNLDQVCDELLNLGVDAEHANELLRGLEYRPGDRHPNAKALTAALFGNAPTPTQPKAQPRPLAPTPPRPEPQLQPAVYGPPMPPKPKHAAVQPDTRRKRWLIPAIIGGAVILALIIWLLAKPSGADTTEELDSIVPEQVDSIACDTTVCDSAAAPEPEPAPAPEPARKPTRSNSYNSESMQKTEINPQPEGTQMQPSIPPTNSASKPEKATTPPHQTTPTPTPTPPPCPETQE